MTPDQKKQILDALHAIQDADSCLLGIPQGETGSQVMAYHRQAAKSLLLALGLWRGTE